MPSVFSSIKHNYTALIHPPVRVGIIELSGTIDSATDYLKRAEELFTDTSIRAVVLKIDSGGGAAGGSQALYKGLQELKRTHNKVLIAYIENIGASGAYYASCAADVIVATGTALIGSIGVYVGVPNVKDLINTYHVQYEIIKSGEYKCSLNPFNPISDQERALVQGVSDDTYRQFIEDVALSRPKLTIDKAAEWANGRIFTAAQGARLGLIDELGTMATVEKIIRSKTAIEGEIDWVYPPEPGLFERLFERKHSMSTFLPDMLRAYAHTMLSTPHEAPRL